MSWKAKVTVLAARLGWSELRVITGLLNYTGPLGSEGARRRFWEWRHRAWLATASLAELAAWLDLRSATHKA